MPDEAENVNKSVIILPESVSETSKRFEAERQNSPTTSRKTDSPGETPGTEPTDTLGNTFNPDWHQVYINPDKGPVGSPVTTKKNRLMFKTGVKATLEASGQSQPPDTSESNTHPNPKQWDGSNDDSPGETTEPQTLDDLMDEYTDVDSESVELDEEPVHQVEVVDLDEKAEANAELLVDLWSVLGRCIAAGDGKLDTDERSKIFKTAKRHVMDGGRPLPIMSWFQHLQAGASFVTRIFLTDGAAQRWGTEGKVRDLAMQFKEFWTQSKPKGK